MIFQFKTRHTRAAPRVTVANRWFRSLLVGLLSGLWMAAQAQESALPRFQPEDVFALEFAADPQIAPDGDRVAYERVSMDIMTDRARRGIWLVDINGQAHEPLVSGPGKYTSPRWSPEGDRLAYLAKEAGQTQLRIRWLESGADINITSLPQSPSGVTWSPDGRSIAFTRLVPRAPEPLSNMPEKPKGAQWAPPATQVDTMVYRCDGAGYLPTGTRHLFVVPAEGGTPRQLTVGDYPMSNGITWTPDSSSIIFSANRRADYEYQPRQTDLFEVNLADGRITQVTERAGPEGAPTLSPDGRYLAFRAASDARQGFNPDQVHLLDRETGTTRSLTEDFDRSVDDVQWDPDGKRLWIRYDDHGIARLAALSLTGKRTDMEVTLGGLSIGRPYSSGDFSVGGKGRVVYTRGDPEAPADLALLERGKARGQLTHLNRDLLDYRDMAAVESFNWASSHDGQAIEGWIMKPPGFDPNQRYPLILEIHGGPHAAYGPNFSTEAQLYAAAGYVVLYSNPRGSTSYGETFANSIDLAYPGYDYDDLMSGVDALLAAGFVDPKQLFVTGGSGGGVLTAWIVGKTDRFSAAVVAKPVINWASFVLTADLNYYFATTWFASPPWEDPMAYWERSPLSLVGNVSTPTMLLTGEADYRTPMSETEQYYQALKHRGIDTLMVRIPGASHGIYARPSNLIAKVGNILGWFERYRPED